jgi:hypothetical protein
MKIIMLPSPQFIFKFIFTNCGIEYRFSSFLFVFSVLLHTLESKHGYFLVVGCLSDNLCCRSTF